MGLRNYLADLACKAGIVGAGGAGFPTQVKLDTQVDILIVNGAECEPLITVDQALMLRDGPMLAQILEELRTALSAEYVRIAIKAKHRDIITVINSAISSYPNISVFPLEDFYPAGDEVVAVYEVTGRQVPQGGIPLQAGVVVINVETVWNLARAKQEKMNTHKWVTVAGRAGRPGVYRVPLGIAKRELLAAAEALPDKYERVIEGGPMMGALLEDIDSPVTKTTKALLVLPDNSPVVINSLRPLEYNLKQARSMCCQCRMCSDLCPRGLLGYSCEPHRTILAASYGWQVGGEGVTQALACSECGVCDQYACPMGLSPRRVNQMLKKVLGVNQASDPNKGLIPRADFWRPYRKLPGFRLRRRLGLDCYHSPAVIHNTRFSPSRVELLLKQHIGAPSVPAVKEGDEVELGRLIARIPEGSPVSSNLHASISGKVAGVTPDRIIIEGRE